MDDEKIQRIAESIMHNPEILDLILYVNERYNEPIDTKKHSDKRIGAIVRAELAARTRVQTIVSFIRSRGTKQDTTEGAPVAPK